MKKIILSYFAFLITCASIAQTADTTKPVKLWKKGGVGAINFSQSSFTNWAAGGENALSATALLTVFSNYKKEKTTWDNSLDLAYGMIQSGKNPLRKNEDKIDLTSKFGHYAFLDHWYYSALINFKSQFTNGYTPPNDSVVVSRFMAPGYLIGAIGMDYKTKDNSLSLFISPVTSKTTFVNDQRLANAGSYGVTPAQYDSINGIYVITKYGHKVRTEFGGYLKVTFKKDIVKNVNLATKLELFSNYLRDPQNIDVNWEVLIAMKINKFMTASISTNMIYDNDIHVPVTRKIDGIDVEGTGPRLQFKEVFAIGLSYKF
jgi:hypothetical protein